MASAPVVLNPAFTGGGVASGNLYKFKDIKTVPAANDLVDIVLSKTQRKTPTEVHTQFKISRIRSFYMRKIKFCQQTYHDKLGGILTDFPKLDEIHPFYGDLCNVLYDRDHYKLALGQVNSVKGIVDTISKDYVRLLKYADSLYKCKMLKRAALGRMSTAVKKLKSCLPYLEEVRQHLGRLPSINPNMRTLILTGYPNVGKSSFMNQISHANVDVQPYAFTTKSLFVGHFDYSYLRWQVIDTPGILDHPLEERNTIEMVAVTALAHIHAAILYVLDVSEECGYSIKAQVQLFNSIKPLFSGKPLLILLNKIDTRKVSDLSEEEAFLIKGMVSEDAAVFIETSTLTGHAVDDAKNTACQLLLEQRVSKKSENRKVHDWLGKMQVTSVKLPATRPACIPESVLRKRLEGNSGSQDLDVSSGAHTEKSLEQRFGGAGVYSTDLRKNYKLADPEWKYDQIPEIFNEKNVSDFIDPEIEQKLLELEEEEQRYLEQFEDEENLEEEAAWMQTQAALKLLSLKVEKVKKDNKLRRSQQGVIAAKVRRFRQKASSSAEGGISGKDEPNAATSIPSKAKQLTEAAGSSLVRYRDHSSHLESRLTKGLPKGASLRAIEKIRWRQQKSRNLRGMAGDGDHFIGTKNPKHLLAGKRGIGKASHR